MAEKKVKETGRIKAFASVKKHWSETLVDPSADLETSCGRFFVYLHRIKNVNHDGFRPNRSPFFPYGVKSISSGGELSGMHLYFTAIMSGVVKDPDKRQHYQITLYLPGLKETFIGADIFHYGLQEREFEMFYQPTSGKKKKPDPLVTSSNQGWQPLNLFPSFEDGGLITIPDDLKMTRGIEISIKAISQKEWEKGPWRFTDVTRSISFMDEMKRSGQEGRLPPDASNRFIGASS